MKILPILATLATLPIAAIAFAQMAGPKIQPGLWETSSEVLEMAMPGMPAGVSPDMLKRMKPAKTLVRACITPQQAANPSANMLAAQRDHKCDVRKMAMSGGMVSIAMRCADPKRGSTMDMTMTGRYSRTDYSMVGDMKMSGARGMAMSMKTRVISKRVGDCKS